MKRFSLGLIFAAALFATPSCDDDDDKVTIGDAAVDGSIGPGMCVATFAAYDRTTLHAMTRPSGACAAAADLDVICSKDVGGVARTCGRFCVQNGGGQDCTSTCVKQGINPSVSEPCLSCYSQAFNCTIKNCVDACLSDSASPGCVACQQQNGCLAIFYTCSGLPSPSTGSDGGADASQGN